VMGVAAGGGTLVDCFLPRCFVECKKRYNCPSRSRTMIKVSLVCYYTFIISCSSLIIIRFLFIVVCVYSCVFLYLIMNIVFGYDSDSEYVL